MELLPIPQDLTIDDVIDEFKKHYPFASAEGIERAFAFAEKVHEKDQRLTGEPFITHPLHTAHILAQLGLDDKTIMLALLHDTLENKPNYPLYRTSHPTELEKKFDKDLVKAIVDITNINQLPFKCYEEHRGENHQKLFLTATDDARVIMTLIASRLHNLRTILNTWSTDRKNSIAQETFAVHIPLATRLGLYRLKWEMENRCMKILQPDAYKGITALVKSRETLREDKYAKLRSQIAELINDYEISADITHRFKTIYSIHKKMKQRNKQFEDVYDIIGFRVVLPTIEECYYVLDLLHTEFKTVEGRLKDYIAYPKPNGYQSIHTTVQTKDGITAEFQIRTHDMHEQAEYGIAAHWVYDIKKRSERVSQSRVSWFSDLLTWKSNVGKKKLDAILKLDFLRDRIFVFTPQGELKDLPKGSTPIDFAFRIHTRIGEQLTGALVNDKIVPLSTKLQNGDVIEILTNRAAPGPKKDWLKMVGSKVTKSKIRAYLKKKEKPNLKPQTMDGITAPRPTSTPIRSAETHTEPTPYATPESLHGILVKRGQCCDPKEGDDIVGYITKANMITLHKSNCEELIYKNAPRIIPMKWE
jgi:guanosine-3',5'-bis(diphosphate) 3'-pyrophosphohydrolase